MNFCDTGLEGLKVVNYILLELSMYSTDCASLMDERFSELARCCKVTLNSCRVRTRKQKINLLLARTWSYMYWLILSRQVLIRIVWEFLL